MPIDANVDASVNANVDAPAQRAEKKFLEPSKPASRGRGTATAVALALFQSACSGNEDSVVGFIQRPYEPLQHPRRPARDHPLPSRSLPIF
ncbi:MAG: hypothetical protein JWO62_2429 [Acidimicrobiaceae bacterium]|jgi:hypothetical protein|nr:hypothetical protein [Acidimicrobiaceae bacterium]